MSDISDALSPKIEAWKDALLDVSKRNRLLHFKPEAALGLTEPALDELWKRLVKTSKTQTIYQEQDFAFDDEESESELASEIPVQAELKKDEIRPSLNGVKLPRTLYNLRSKGNLSMEEQGVPTLFVAWGLVRWRDDSAETIFSPLLLTPATLLREGGKTGYRLKVEDDIRLNPVLNWKLRTEFKIELPDAPEADEDVFAYFDNCAAILEKRVGWGVVESAHLGLFAFHKMAMYEDLRDNAERALRNPFRARAGRRQFAFARAARCADRQRIGRFAHRRGQLRFRLRFEPAQRHSSGASGRVVCAARAAGHGEKSDHHQHHRRMLGAK